MDRPTRFRAFSLLEMVLALCVASFALVAILGLFPIGLSSARESIHDTRSAHLSRSIVATLRGQPYGGVNLFGEKLDLAEAAANGTVVTLFADEQGAFQTTEDGTMIAQPEPDTRYFVTVRFIQGPSDLPSGTACTVRSDISWEPNEAARADSANRSRGLFITTIARF